MNPERLAAIRETLVTSFHEGKLWQEVEPASILPLGMARGSDSHLAFLTLVYALSGGRNPDHLWTAARATYADDPELFDLKFLAYSQGKALIERLSAHRLAKKRDATTWQKTGQALVMRAGGSVKTLLEKHNNDAKQLLEMLNQNKATFPVLSGEQTAPRWLWGLANHGDQQLAYVDELFVPISPAGESALNALQIEASKVRITAGVWEALNTLERLGCRQHEDSQPICPVSRDCAMNKYCQFAEN